MANKYRSVLASGGGVQPTGNAQPADVLSGKTFSNADGIDKTGTMVNNGAVSETVNGGQTYTIPAGYHNGAGTVTGAGYTVDTVTNCTFTSGNAQPTATYQTAITGKSHVAVTKLKCAIVLIASGQPAYGPIEASIDSTGLVTLTLTTGQGFSTSSSAVEADLAIW